MGPKWRVFGGIFGFARPLNGQFSSEGVLSTKDFGMCFGPFGAIEFNSRFLFKVFNFLRFRDHVS